MLFELVLFQSQLSYLFKPKVIKPMSQPKEEYYEPEIIPKTDVTQADTCLRRYDS